MRESVQLSDYTLTQYKSALRIFFYWIKENANDKNFWEIKPKDFMLYQNFMVRNGLSSSAIRFKRSAVSSFNAYIETYDLDTYPNFRNFISKKIAAPKQVFVHEKEPLTLAEYKNLCEVLEERELWQPLAYLKFSYASGCRRTEATQVLKEVVNSPAKTKDVLVKDENGNDVIKQSKSYFTGDIRCKGSGKTGKVRRLQFDEEAMVAIKRWLDSRGKDDCPYVFVSKGKDGTYHQISGETFNLWCKKIFEEIVGRRVHPHLFRETRATTLVVEQGKDITVAQKLLGHESSVTTNIYVIRKDEEDSDEAFV